MEIHLFLSDFQIPDQNDLAIAAVLKFIPDLKPDYVHLVGDILNLDKLSTHAPSNPYDEYSFQDEIAIGKRILKQIVTTTRKYSRNATFYFYEGNHEARMLKYLARKVPELATLADEDEYLLSIPHLLKLKDLGIKWVEYYADHKQSGMLIEHGNVVRAHATFSAKAMMERRGVNGVSGHTHRLGMYMITQVGKTRWWIENGSLCKLHFHSPYAKNNNWQTGFSVVYYDPKTHTLYPQIVPIIDNSFVFNKKVYRA